MPAYLLILLWCIAWKCGFPWCICLGVCIFAPHQSPYATSSLRLWLILWNLCSTILCDRPRVGLFSALPPFLSSAFDSQNEKFPCSAARCGRCRLKGYQVTLANKRKVASIDYHHKADIPYFCGCYRHFLIFRPIPHAERGGISTILAVTAILWSGLPFLQHEL